MADDLAELGRRRAGKELNEIGPRGVDVDQHAGEPERIRGHRLLGHRSIDGVAGDIAIDDVEALLAAPVDLDDASPFDANAGLRSTGPAHAHRPHLGRLLNDLTFVPRPLGALSEPPRSHPALQCSCISLVNYFFR